MLINDVYNIVRFPIKKEKSDTLGYHSVHLILVESAGIAPVSKKDPTKASTVYLILIFSIGINISDILLCETIVFSTISN